VSKDLAPAGVKRKAIEDAANDDSYKPKKQLQDKKPEDKQVKEKKPSQEKEEKEEPDLPEKEKGPKEKKDPAKREAKPTQKDPSSKSRKAEAASWAQAKKKRTEISLALVEAQSLYESTPEGLKEFFFSFPGVLSCFREKCSKRIVFLCSFGKKFCFRALSFQPQDTVYRKQLKKELDSTQEVLNKSSTYSFIMSDIEGAVSGLGQAELLDFLKFPIDNLLQATTRLRQLVRASA